jgi:hypothetical protein
MAVFNRDSVLWLLVLAGSVLTYLANAPAPITWTWAQWMQALSALVGIVAGWLRSSPLRGAQRPDDDGLVPPAKLVALVLLVALVPMTIVGCGPKTKPNLAKADYALYQSVKAISDTEVVLSRAGLLTPAQSLRINESLLPAAKLGLEGTQALRAWKPGQPLPPQIPRLVDELRDISEVIIEAVAKPEARAALLERVAIAQQAILAIVALGVL